MALVWSVGAPRVRNSVSDPQPTDPTQICKSLPTPVGRVADMNSALPAYLAINGGPSGLVAVDMDGLAQASLAGMAQRFPALTRLQQLDFRAGPEQVLLMRPGVVFAGRSQGASLTSLGYPGVCFFDDTPASMRAMWKLVGRIRGSAVRAQQVLERVNAKERQLATTLASRPPVSAVILFSGVGYSSVAGRGYYLTDMLELAGGRNPTKGYASTPQVDLEQLAVLDPDVILLNGQPGDVVFPSDLYARPEWGVLRAVRARRVYKIPGFAVFPGPVERPLLERWLAEVLHDDLPREFRSDFRDAYRSGYGYDAGESDMDRALYLKENSGSLGYQRFAAVRGSDAVSIHAVE